MLELSSQRSMSERHSVSRISLTFETSCVDHLVRTQNNETTPNRGSIYDARTMRNYFMSNRYREMMFREQ
jgi:hypothetical protein